MYIFILVIHIIVSLVLIAVILLQAGKGGGLADTFGGGGSSQTTIFGQKTADFLTKATTASAILFLCTALSLAILSSKRKKSLMEGVKIAPVAEEASQATKNFSPETVTIKEVKINPETGEETVVKEETRPATEEEKQDFSGK
ncbi:MAG: preprotein translocase subunit SecG [Candidatus Omnitrophica bacterium]|nr:preprotein translocase subunit SecG [Candidatus Omnitrophota bacterium]